MEPGEVGTCAGSQKGQRREEETGRQPDQSPHPELSAPGQQLLEGLSSSAPRLSEGPDLGHERRKGGQPQGLIPLGTLRTEPSTLTLVWTNHSTFLHQDRRYAQHFHFKELPGFSSP